MSVRHASRSLVDILAPCKPSNYICRQCRRNRQIPSILTQQRGYASEGPEGLPFAERVRRKLWQGKPPGPENVDDLYGGPGAIEKMYRERQRRRLEAAAAEDESETIQAEAVNTSRNKTPAPVRKQFEQEIAAEADTSEVISNDVEASPTDAEKSTEYKSATTWDGLYYVGHKGNWKEMPVKSQDEYSRWLESPIRPAWTYEDLVSLMHQSIVECHTCKKSGLEPTVSSSLRVSSSIPQEQLEAVSISVSSDGTFSGTDIGEVPLKQGIDSYYRQIQNVSGPSKTYSLAEGDAILKRTQPDMKPLEPRLLYKPKDVSFLDAKLNITDNTAFAILKRFAILTNHTIPDPLINDLASSDPTKSTIGALLAAMAEHIKPKPANLAEQLLNDPILASQGNLLVLGRRETPVDKEKEVGRWKVIEEELKARGLPVLGHRA